MNRENRLLVAILAVLAASVLLTSGLTVYLVLTREQEGADIAAPGESRTPPTLAHERESAVSVASEPRIAFVSSRAGEWAIYVTKADDWQPQRISMADQITCTCPSWSPDGQRVAYLAQGLDTGYDVWVATTDGAEYVCLNEDASDILPVPPTWSPDGTLLAFVAGGEPAEWDDLNSVAYIARTDGTGIEWSATLPFRVRRLAWSPTDDAILVVSDEILDTEHPIRVKSYVYVSSREGEESTFIAQISNEARAADWSPDGREIL
ncbi:MAG: PD40 domain-containing protein, partial [Anaerolineae bacterium]|nr:PD40 domain-containing protein [Anaerolineae bacterium]